MTKDSARGQRASPLSLSVLSWEVSRGEAVATGERTQTQTHELTRSAPSADLQQGRRKDVRGFHCFKFPFLQFSDHTQGHLHVSESRPYRALYVPGTDEVRGPCRQGRSEQIKAAH